MRGNPSDGIHARLNQVLLEESLPSNARDYGENLLRRFGTPVRVVILGLPGSGKTQLMNMLLGRNLIADGRALPAMEITAGASWRTRVSRQDETTLTFDGLVLEGSALAGARMLTLEVPLRTLERINFLEVSGDASIESQRQAIEFGAKRAEILIWCTQEFSETERLLWNLVPNALKDHAFMALTKADELQRAGVLSPRLDLLNATLVEEFCGIFPVATLHALSAFGNNRIADEAAFVASGGRALRAALLKHVEQGRRADVDNALLFLRRFEAARVGEMKAGASAVEPPAHRDPGAASAGSGERQKLLERALCHLRARSIQLAELVPEAGADKYATFLSACVETADGLAKLLAEHDSATASTSLPDSVAEASEVMLLLQLEKGMGPAADAATLLLQMRRELEDELAG